MNSAKKVFDDFIGKIIDLDYEVLFYFDYTT
jgi:hypothetical protein